MRKNPPNLGTGKLDLGPKNQAGLEGLKLLMNDNTVKELMREEMWQQSFNKLIINDKKLFTIIIMFFYCFKVFNTVVFKVIFSVKNLVDILNSLMTEVGPLLMNSANQQALIANCTAGGIHIQCHDQKNVRFYHAS